MQPSTFDMTDMTDLFGLTDKVEEPAEAAAPDGTMTELEQWAEQQLADRPEGTQAVVLDIETGPRPIEEIECFYVPPEPLPPWDESMVKYGNAKREELRAEKRTESITEYQKKLVNETAERAVHKAAWLDKAALSPVTGRVLLIGILNCGKPFYYDTDSEANNLTAFWAFVDEALANKRPLIGHNSNGFDLPFLVRRSWSLGVAVPREVRQGRYWHPLFQDTMEHWNCGHREYISLNTLGAFFGIGQKTEGVEGTDFAKLWFGTMPADPWGTPKEQRAKALEYNGQDLILTAAIAAKIGMM